MSQPPSNVDRLKALLADAIELAPDDRDRLVQEVMREDSTLGSDLKRLLAAHDSASEGAGFMADPTLDPSQSIVDRRLIGPFKTLKLIGEGGFGEVYLAEQSAPIRRQVALKLIKLGMDSNQILARFDAERQALAIMDHPNIAKVYDAGTDERGRPWFAMELVNGLPINQYADKHRLSVRSRIELMIPVCRAVHHAHQKGVIHRDLKPGNVLVSQGDGAPVPKVIDFGVAKALGRPLTDKTIFTEMRSLVGTPEYMSPEQADFDGGRDIDTRSDVYSLGVLLYELLVGATPFDGRDLRSRAFGEIQRILREVDPPTPSTRFSTLQTRANAAATRDMEPARLSSTLRGELDWITMKCLEKDRTRRYDTASALADELGRFLENKTITAGPHSMMYRARKFAKRHRVGVIAGSLISLAILAGIAGIVWGSIQARRERDDAIRAREQAEQSRQAAESARVAESEAKTIAQEHNRFLRDMFASIDPSAARGREIAVKEVLDAGRIRIDAAPPSNPNVEAALRATFGVAYSSLGDLATARKQLERARALGDASSQTQLALIDVMRYQGELEPAIALTRRALEHPAADADEFSPLFLQMALANLFLKQDKHDEAETMLKSVLASASQVAATRPAAISHITVDATVMLAAIMSGDGRFNEAETLLRGALQTTRERGELDTPAGIEICSNLGDLYRSLGRFEEAIELLNSSRQSALKVLGADHPDTLSTTNNLALSMMTMGRLDESESLYDDLITRRTRLLGPDHPQTLLARSNRALVYQQQNRLDLAEKEFADLSQRYPRALGVDHYDTIVALNNYATILLKLNRAGEAEPIFRDLVERARRTQGEKSLPFVSILLRLANTLSIKGDFPGAEPIFAQAFAGAEAIGIADRQGGFALGYGLCLAELGKAEQAISVLTRADNAMRRMPAPDPLGLRKLAEGMAKVHAQLGHASEADRWRAISLSPTTQPTTLPTTLPSTQPTP